MPQCLALFKTKAVFSSGNHLENEMAIYAKAKEESRFSLFEKLRWFVIVFFKFAKNTITELTGYIH